MRALFFILSISLLASCAELKPENPIIENTESFNEQLSQYVNSFFSDAGLFNLSPPRTGAFTVDFQPLGFSPVSGGQNGECRITSVNGTISKRTVKIDPVYWSLAHEHQKRILVYHELGHCNLLRPHKEDQDESGRPLSIMYPVTFSEYYFEIFRDEYMNELFTNNYLVISGYPRITDANSEGYASYEIVIKSIVKDNNQECIKTIQNKQ